MSTNRKVEDELRRWLRGHHTVIGWDEALRLGATKTLVLAKNASGEWNRIYRGVYRDASAPRIPYQALRAAFVAAGGYGVISHRSAAWIWGFVSLFPEQPELSIGAGSDAARKREGLIVHRSRDLNNAQIAIHRTLRVTTPLRTLVDLAAFVSPSTLADAIDAGLASKFITPAGLEAEIGRLSRPGRPGVGPLRRHLAERGFIGAPAPSVLESRMGRLILSIRPVRVPVPTPELCVGSEGEYRLDFAWPAVMFAVEVDGFAFHSSPESARRDKARRNQLRRSGWTLREYTWVDVVRDPERVQQEIASDYLGCLALRAS